jgi:esterase/lipase superfamily enzyme
MKRDAYRWDSPTLGCPMDLVWFGERGQPLVIFPTSMGSCTENEDFQLCAALEQKVDEGHLQLVCVSTVDKHGLYAKERHPSERIRVQDLYDRYLANELVPHAQQRSGRPRVHVYGASFGAYHATNFACRNPELVDRCVAFSGVFDIKSFLDGYWDELCYFHSPTAYLPNLNDEWVRRLAQVDLVVATGELDSLYDKNRAFVDMLAKRGIRHRCEWWPGVFGHDWPFWRQHLPRYV